jgi:hypothetical protein
VAGMRKNWGSFPEVKFSGDSNNVKTGSGAHPAFYPLCSAGWSFHGSKAARVWRWRLTFI